MDYFHLSFPSSICSRSSCFGVVFSIGLFMLNQDGTIIVDDNTGQPIPTYTNKDVMNFARGFTNFAHQGNVSHNVHLPCSSQTEHLITLDLLYTRGSA